MRPPFRLKQADRFFKIAMCATGLLAAGSAAARVDRLADTTVFGSRPSSVPYPDQTNQNLILDQIDLKVEFLPAGWADVSMAVEFTSKKNQTVKFIQKVPVQETLIELDKTKIKGKLSGRRASKLESLFGREESHAFLRKFTTKLPKGSHRLVSGYLQPLWYGKIEGAPSRFKFDLELIQLNKWGREKIAKVNIKYLAPEDYLESYAAIRCKIAEKKKIFELDAKINKERKIWEYTASTGLIRGVKRLYCEIYGGPDYGKKALSEQKKLRSEVNEDAKHLAE